MLRFNHSDHDLCTAVDAAKESSFMDKILEELKKFNFTSAPSVPQRDEWQDTVTEVKKIIEKKADKTLVSAEPCAFSLESTQLPGSRFYADINTAHLECFFHKGDLDYLVVFFSGSRSRGGKDLVPYPTFSSWSWYKEVNASILCIDDPMYHTFEQIACGWYYGTQTDDFRQDTAELIKKIADLLGVSQRHILLYGRSAGGTAAVAVSDFINGCCVCAVNAQFDIENYKWYAKPFAEIAGVDYSSEDYKKRNDFARVIRSHPSNTYLLIENLFSDIDMDAQFAYLKKHFHVETQYGVKSYSNLHLWLYAAWGVSAAHNSFDSIPLFKIILDMIVLCSNGAGDSALNILASSANDYWFEHYNHLIKRNRYEKEIRRLNEQISKANQKNTALKKQAASLRENLFSKFLRYGKKILKKVFSS